MNTDALSSRYGKIPPTLQQYAHQVWTHLQQQSGKVVSVHCLPNFQKDHDVSLRLGTDVFKGLVVAVHPDYQLSDADRMWMHPHAYQCRAVFQGGEYTSTELPDMEASAGIYKVSSIDAIGTQCDKTYTIVDTRLPFTRAAQTPLEAYDNSQKQETLAHCRDVAAFFGAENLDSHCFTNLFLKSTTHYVFYNHAFHQEGLVHVSPLMGYRKISNRVGMVAADRLDEQQYVDVHNLEDAQKQQLFDKCQWDSDSPINTYALRATYDPMLNTGTHFRLQKANFASTPIHAQMETEDIYNLSADLNQLGLRFGNLVETQQIRLPAKPETVVKLMALQDLKILNPEFMDGKGNLTLPKHIVEQLF